MTYPYQFVWGFVDFMSWGIMFGGIRFMRFFGGFRISVISVICGFQVLGFNSWFSGLGFSFTVLVYGLQSLWIWVFRFNDCIYLGVGFSLNAFVWFWWWWMVCMVLMVVDGLYAARSFYCIECREGQTTDRKQVKPRCDKQKIRPFANMTTRLRYNRLKSRITPITQGNPTIQT